MSRRDKFKHIAWLILLNTAAAFINLLLLQLTGGISAENFATTITTWMGISGGMVIGSMTAWKVSS